MLSNGIAKWGEQESDHNKLAVQVWTAPDFLNTFEIDLVEGRFYEDGQDSLNRGYVVVNQELVDLLGWEDPVGRDFYIYEDRYTVLGVTENIQFFPFNLGIFEDRALVYRYDPVSNYVFIRMREGSTPEELASVVGIFEANNPGYEVIHDWVGNYQFEALENADGLRFLFILFSSLAVLVAVMGLIGLSVFHNNSRTKEVGIRKVMGAHTQIVLRYLLSGFLKLVVLSNAIAIPVAWLLLNKVFQFFAYRIEIRPLTFVVVFLLSVLLSVVTVVYHALRISRANPVMSLRYE
jgi:putative ABC transport system permease protein